MLCCNLWGLWAVPLGPLQSQEVEPRQGQRRTAGNQLGLWFASQSMGAAGECISAGLLDEESLAWQKTGPCAPFGM